MAKEQLDPVCGMMVDPDQSVYKSSHQDKQYAFCSKRCLDSFKKDPEKYMHPQSQQQD
jgi:Cu+-exporting ATPase